MPIQTARTLIGALLCLPLASQATSTVQRCEDASGAITYTSLGCQAEQHSQQVNAYNAPPGSLQHMLPSGRADRAARAAPRELVVVGQHDDGCGNRLSAEQRRSAIINQRTPAGMTRRDVESLLGRPDKVSQRNGEMRYHYAQKGGRSHQVTFDEDGCVKGKR
ncbi:outer membrane protein assembly factor BamE domain-containing protein [Pseudomonas syringae]|nr:cell envelope protein SmpA [Pseudomonas syringae]